jgi:hypothetical protein
MEPEAGLGPLPLNAVRSGESKCKLFPKARHTDSVFGLSFSSAQGSFSLLRLYGFEEKKKHWEVSFSSFLLPPPQLLPLCGGERGMRY